MNTKWEYKIELIRTCDADEQEKVLNALGCEGWELLSIINESDTFVAYLKRPAK